MLTISLLIDEANIKLVLIIILNICYGMASSYYRPYMRKILSKLD